MGFPLLELANWLLEMRQLRLMVESEEIAERSHNEVDDVGLQMKPGKTVSCG